MAQTHLPVHIKKKKQQEENAWKVTVVLRSPYKTKGYRNIFGLVQL
jgi:hypothetical protein